MKVPLRLSAPRAFICATRSHTIWTATIPGDVQASQLMVTHGHYNHTDADQDINCIFPIDRLREVAAEGIIAGVSDKHLGFMGYTQNFRDLYERIAPEMAKIISRSKADGVILTAG